MPADLPIPSHLEPAPVSASDQEHARRLRIEAASTPGYHAEQIRTLRGLVRLVTGRWSQVEAIRQRVAPTRRELIRLRDRYLTEAPRPPKPLDWPSRPGHDTAMDPLIVREARLACEQAWDRCQRLVYALKLRLHVARGLTTPGQAATALGLDLSGWESFCATEDARDSDRDGQVRDLDVVEEGKR